MKKIMMSIVLLALVGSLSGCYWGPPPGHDRGDRHDRYDRHDREDREDREDDHRDGDPYDRR